MLIMFMYCVGPVLILMDCVSIELSGLMRSYITPYSVVY